MTSLPPLVPGRVSGLVAYKQGEFSAGLWILWGVVLLLALSACAGKPTPYQPQEKDQEEGYEEQRLQEQVWRISFRANRYTREEDVVDFLFLRSAELTLQSGFTHFVVENDYSRTQSASNRGARTGLSMGFGSGGGNSFWGMGFGFSPQGNTDSYVAYHLGMFIVRMLNAQEAAGRKEAYEAAFILKNMEAKKQASLEKGK